MGIINGTSNYILSAMGEHGADYEDALVQAQKLGFAEEDPSLDVNGWDAAHKALILATLAYGTTISPDKIYVSGIENITSRDFEFAKKLGYTIKLLVVIRYHENQEDALELRVQPCFVHDWHILASVNGVFNAISVNGDIVGETLFYGRGAGKNPTASAVISDVITAMRESRYPEFHTGFTPYAKSCGVMHINDTTTPYYVRFQVADQPRRDCGNSPHPGHFRHRHLRHVLRTQPHRRRRRGVERPGIHPPYLPVGPAPDGAGGNCPDFLRGAGSPACCASNTFFLNPNLHHPVTWHLSFKNSEAPP